LTETQFKNQVQKYLNSINAYHVKQHGNRFTKSGVPDILVCLKGKFIGLELKVGKNKPSQLQLYNIDQIQKAGGVGMVLYPEGFEMLKILCEELIG